jgi:hypothetical protein
VSANEWDVRTSGVTLVESATLMPLSADGGNDSHGSLLTSSSALYTQRSAVEQPPPWHMEYSASTCSGEQICSAETERDRERQRREETVYLE